MNMMKMSKSHREAMCWYVNTENPVVLQMTFSVYGLLHTHSFPVIYGLTHFPLVPHISYATENWVSIGSDNGLSPIRRQAII